MSDSRIRSLAHMVAMSTEDAREIVQSVDTLEVLAQQRGMALTPNVRRIREELHQAAAGVFSDEHVSTSDQDPLSRLLFGHDPGVVDTAAAAQQLGISPSGVRDLVRRGRIPAIRRHGRWWVDPNDIEDLKASRQREEQRR